MIFTQLWGEGRAPSLRKADLRVAAKSVQKWALRFADTTLATDAVR